MLQCSLYFFFGQIILIVYVLIIFLCYLIIRIFRLKKKKLILYNGLSPAYLFNAMYRQCNACEIKIFLRDYPLLVKYSKKSHIFCYIIPIYSISDQFIFIPRSFFRIDWSNIALFFYVSMSYTSVRKRILRTKLNIDLLSWFMARNTVRYTSTARAQSSQWWKFSLVRSDAIFTGAFEISSCVFILSKIMLFANAEIKCE